ncbi:uncharacterized protein LOC111708931 [Eurytemora carolleeae]|uniref:uncharacterized protein LOC111708931 n=1 Tax=Eurytemora carolleeae TaxID=1294199 RepID=UPI000C77766C|nr:uncharacterized protein LOC111708931 [Eurytemora carolleeae]|eukprot:XP_023338213.1 uncharacterized protein LOC111708931 [Eurytemora affinis]
MGGVSFDFGNRTRAQSIEEYRAKRRFKQVKLGIVVIVWQLVNMLVILSIVEYRNQPQSPVEQSAEIMTFMVVFVSVFCGWPCLLHCMDGFAKTGVVLSVVNGCLAFQTSIILRGLSFILLRGTSKFDIELHDLTEALLATNSFHIASLFLLGRMPPLHLLLAR